jgi:hypothetical protein
MPIRNLTQTLNSSGLDSDIQENTVGLVIRLTIKEKGQTQNLSTSTVKQIIIGKPDGTKLTKTASFMTDGTDGVIQYVTVLGDLTPAGTFSVQSYLEMPDFQGKSTISTFGVNANI